MNNQNAFFDGFVKGAGLGEWFADLGESIIASPKKMYNYFKNTIMPKRELTHSDLTGLMLPDKSMPSNAKTNAINTFYPRDYPVEFTKYPIPPSVIDRAIKDNIYTVTPEFQNMMPVYRAYYDSYGTRNPRIGEWMNYMPRAAEGIYGAANPPMTGAVADKIFKSSVGTPTPKNFNKSFLRMLDE